MALFCKHTKPKKTNTDKLKNDEKLGATWQKLSILSANGFTGDSSETYAFRLANVKAAAGLTPCDFFVSAREQA